MAMNSIFVISPYRWEGTWVFDDDKVDLVREPFVAGADTMIDVAVERFEIENAAAGFLMVFSANPFPTANICLKWEREDSGGNIYSWAETETVGWLCPAMFMYFETAPEQLYVEVKTKPQ